MYEAEERNLHYLTKLRLTSNVKKLIRRLIAKGEWVDADQGFKGCESTLSLTGWSRSRRVIVLKRPIKGELMLHSVGMQTTHSGQTIVTFTSTHAKASTAQTTMREIASFFKELAATAEQLQMEERIKLIALRAFRKLLALSPPLTTLKLLTATG